MVTYLEWFSSNRILPLYPLFPGCRLLNGRSQAEERRTPPGKSRKINISRQQPLAVLTAGGGGESIKVSSPNSAASSQGRSPSHPLLAAGQRHGRPGGGGYLQWPSVSSVCGCGCGVPCVCRPLENTFCCNGYWHVSSEEPSQPLTAAKLARSHSPGGCVMCTEQQGSGHRGYSTSGDRETGEARVGAWHHLSVWLAAAA